MIHSHRVQAPDQFRSQSFFAPYAYDSVWAIHLGLENAVPQILETCASSSESFVNCSTDGIRENFEMINFLGVSVSYVTIYRNHAEHNQMYNLMFNLVVSVF